MQCIRIYYKHTTVYTRVYTIYSIFYTRLEIGRPSDVTSCCVTRLHSKYSMVNICCVTQYPGHRSKILTVMLLHCIMTSINCLVWYHLTSDFDSRIKLLLMLVELFIIACFRHIYTDWDGCGVSPDKVNIVCIVGKVGEVTWMDVMWMDCGVRSSGRRVYALDVFWLTYVLKSVRILSNIYLFLRIL